MINESEIRKAISILKPDDQLFEVRVIYNNKQMYSGYFKSADDLIKALDRDIREYANCNMSVSYTHLSSSSEVNKLADSG